MYVFYLDEAPGKRASIQCSLCPSHIIDLSLVAARRHSQQAKWVISDLVKSATRESVEKREITLLGYGGRYLYPLDNGIHTQVAISKRRNRTQYYSGFFSFPLVFLFYPLRFSSNSKSFILDN